MPTAGEDAAHENIEGAFNTHSTPKGSNKEQSPSFFEYA